MHISLDTGQGVYQIRGYDAGWVQVNERRIECPLIISPEVLIEPWPVADITRLQAQELGPLLALAPRIVLLGTGATLRFPAQETLRQFTAQGIGVEVMDTPAACRTYVALAAEGRRVAAGLVVG